MSLKVLMLRNKVNAKKKTLEELRSSVDFEKREQEIEVLINELSDESTEEERNAVEEEVDKFDKEKKEHDEKVKGLKEEIDELEEEIKKVESEQPKPEEKANERGGKKGMERRTKFFGMSIEERDAFFNDENVKNFLSEVRTAIKEKRDIKNVGLTVPTQVLGLVRENVLKYSKLYNRVNSAYVKGKGRELIMGTVPEAVWTEMCANLNELDLMFNDVEVDGYMVGGFFAICRAKISDSDIDLATEIISALGQSIGYALDKAILYGKGIKMPLGVVTRLAQKTQPEDYPATARKWENLSTSNIKKITGSGLELFKNLLLGTSAIKGKYSRGIKLWCMNEQTHTSLVAEAMNTNMAGAIVSGVEGKMPVIGGDIVEFDFIPDGDVIVGYFDLYLLSEREGTRIETSDHAQFISDRRIFKGLARYDGTPVIAEAFEVFNIENKEVTTEVLFAADTANPSDYQLSGLTIGNNKLFPSFKADTTDYMITPSSATSVINATTANPKAKVVIKNGETTVTNGQSASWKEGVNDVEITVSYMGNTNKYNITVTKTAA